MTNDVVSITREDLEKELTDRNGKWRKTEYDSIIESTKDMANILILSGIMTKEQYCEAVEKLVDIKTKEMVQNVKEDELGTIASFMMNLFGVEDY